MLKKFLNGVQKQILQFNIQTILDFMQTHRNFFTFLFMVCAVFLTHVAMAWNTPSAGDFAYQVYYVAIKKIAEGPVGMVVGTGCLAGSVFAATRSAWVPAVTLAVSSGILYRLDALATSLGYTI